MKDWWNYQATLKILIFSLLAGAALPGLFALGLRLESEGVGHYITADGSPPRRHPVRFALSWLIFAFVVAAIVFSVLYIAKDFIAHHTGYHFMGANPHNTKSE